MNRIVSATKFTVIAGTLLSLAIASLNAQPVQITITGADLAAGQVGAAAFLPVQRTVGAPPIQPAGPLGDIPLAVPSVPSPGYYPDDVTNPNSGPTLQNYVTHNVFVNPIITAPGVYSQSSTGPTLNDVDTFEKNLFASGMIHILDQYTASVGPVGQDGVITFNSYHHTYTDQDLQMLVHAAGRVLGSGLGNAIHLFFPQGTDICSYFGGTTEECYSPDVPSTFYWCGFHDSMLFSDIGRVVFSIEPYVNVSGCRVPSGSPNGRAIDSMANVLSHETFEMTSDPQPDSNPAWYNRLNGEEMADICDSFVFDVALNGTKYRIQSEYSNVYHGCSWNQ